MIKSVLSSHTHTDSHSQDVCIKPRLPLFLFLFLKHADGMISKEDVVGSFYFPPVGQT